MFRIRSKVGGDLRGVDTQIIGNCTIARYELRQFFLRVRPPTTQKPA